MISAIINTILSEIMQATLNHSNIPLECSHSQVQILYLVKRRAKKILRACERLSEVQRFKAYRLRDAPTV